MRCSLAEAWAQPGNGREVDVKRTRKISVETERLLVISQQKATVSWCEICKQHTRMLGPREAAAISGQSERAIFHRIEARELHFTETPDGALLICLKSLLEQI